MATQKYTREQFQAFLDLASKAKPLMLKDDEGSVSELRDDGEYTLQWDPEKLTFTLKTSKPTEED